MILNKKAYYSITKEIRISSYYKSKLKKAKKEMYV